MSEIGWVVLIVLVVVVAFVSFVIGSAKTSGGR